MDTWLIVLLCTIGGLLMLLGIGVVAGTILALLFIKSGGDIHCDIDLRKEECPNQ